MVALFLTFGQRRVEVLPRGGLSSICQQAEAALGLRPGSFELQDACGAVDSDDTLKRLLASETGFCVLEVHEHPEWQRMREMDEQIQALLAREAAREETAALPNQTDVKDLEAKILAHVDKALDEFREQLKDTKAEMQATLEKALAGISQKHVATSSLEAHRTPELSKTEVPGCTVHDFEALRSKVDNIEVELSEQAIMSSAISGHLESGLSAAQNELKTLRQFTADQLLAINGKVESIEVDLSEQEINTSSATGHLECGLAAAQQSLETLRRYTADQVQDVRSKFEALELESTEQALTTSAVTGHLESGLSAAKTELATMRKHTTDQLSSMHGKVEALEVEVTEQSITTASVHGHLECGLSAAKQELQTLRSSAADHFGMSKKDEELKSQMQAVRLNSQEALAGVEALKKEVRRLAAAGAEQKLLDKSPISMKQRGGDTSQWSDGFTTHTLNAFPYSTKSLVSLKAGPRPEVDSAATAPFARQQQLGVSRSVPHLVAER